MGNDKIKKTFLSARWEHLVMANYVVPPEVLVPFLPKGVELDFYSNRTYVSLVGFKFKSTRLFNIPIPFFGTFEEINLRFYVKRIDQGVLKRGVVFINETVPHKSVAWMANSFYKEHYTVYPTKSMIIWGMSDKEIRYEWKVKNEWNHIAVRAAIGEERILPESIEEFIFEHYYGYTKINDNLTEEYRVNHPRWEVNKVEDYSINCNFPFMYGGDFSFLIDQKPDSVLLAVGSEVTVDWKRVPI